MPIDMELLQTLAAAQADQDQPDRRDPAALPYFDYIVHMGPDHDPPVLECHADQRDLRQAMKLVGGIEAVSDPLGMKRATAWAYLHRVGATKWSWPMFDAEVPFVLDALEQTYADPTTAGTGS